MGAILESFGAIAPYFGIVLVGYAAARRGVLTEAGLAGINAYVFAIALPPLLFRTMSAAPDLLSAAPFVALYGAATLAAYGAARAIGWAVFGLPPAERTLFAHLSANGNVGFLGLPLTIAALGEAAALPVALALTFDILVMMTLTTLLLERARSAARPGRALRAAFTSPIVLGALAGLAWGQAGIPTPAPLATFLDALGSSAGPTALFAVGATLAFKTGDRRVAELGTICVLKLLAAPALVAGAFVAYAAIAGAPAAPELWIAAAILTAASPSSNNAVIFAGVYGVYEARASATVLVATALAVGAFAVTAVLVR